MTLFYEGAETFISKKCVSKRFVVVQKYVNILFISIAIHQIIFVVPENPRGERKK